jgi:hypothetical protein
MPAAANTPSNIVVNEADQEQDCPMWTILERKISIVASRCTGAHVAPVRHGHRIGPAPHS